MTTQNLLPLDDNRAPVATTVDTSIPLDDDSSKPVVLSPDFIREKAYKFDFALADGSPGLQKLEADLNAGREPLIRQNAALENDSKIRQARFEVIDQMSKQAVMEGRELSPSERQTILDLSSADFEAIRTDPSSFLEKEYARRVFQKAQEIGDSTWDKVAEEDEEYAFATEDKFVNVLARKELFQNIAEEENKRAADQSWAGWGVDMATSLIPGFTWYQLNNALKGHTGTSFLPGNNLAEQVDYLHMLPPEEAAKLGKQAVEELRGYNQLIAQQFANALVNYSAGSQMIDNLFIGGVDIATFGAGAAVRGARAFANNAEALGKAVGGRLVRPVVEAPPPKEGSVRLFFALTDDELKDTAAKANWGSTQDKVVQDYVNQRKARGESADLYYVDVNEGSYPFLEPGMPADTVTRGATFSGNIQRDFIEKAAKVRTPAEKRKLVLNYTSARTAKVASKPGVHPAEVADVMGDIDTAASLTVLEKISERLARLPTGAKEGFEDLMNQVPGFVNFYEITNGVRSGISAEATRRIVARLGEYTDEALQRIFLDPTAAARLTPETLRIGMQEQREVFKNLYRLPEDAILRVTTSEPGEAGVDVIFAKIHLGDTSGGLHASEEAAFNYARDIIGLKAGEFRAMPEGNNWYIEVARPIDETSPAVRASLRIDREGATDLGNIIGKAIASFRTGAETLPKDIHESLVNSAVGGSKLSALLGKMSQDFVGIKDKKAFFEFLDSQRRFHEGVDAIRVGKFNNTIGEFEADWRAQFGRLPTEQEAQAYFTYTKMNDIHYVSMNLSRWTDKMRTGHAEFKIDGFSVPLEGKIIPTGEIPQGNPTDIGRIFVRIPSKEDWDLPQNISNFGSKKFEELKDLIKQKNLVVIQLSPWGRQVARDLDELSDVGGKSGIDFVVIPRHWVTEKKLSMRQSPHRPGGHIIYDENASVLAQPRVVRQFGAEGRETILKYYGDTTILPLHKNVDPVDIAKRFNTARTMLRDLKEAKKGGVVDKAGWANLKKYVESNLPITYKSFLHDYSSKGKLDLNVPILYSKTNKSLEETWNIKDQVAPNENLLYVRESDSIYNTYAGQVNLKFAQERGLLLGEAQNIGSKEVPLYGMRQTSLIDPMAALERSMQTMVRGRSFESAKWEAGEKFVAEFGGPNGVLKASDDELYRDPVMAMLHGEFRNDADPDLLRAANVYRARVQQFFGLYKTPDQKAMGYVADKLLSTIDKDSGRYFDMAADKILSIKDPVQSFKAIAFHSVMGFMNIKQALLNANSSTHIIGLAGPINGGKAVAAALVNSIAMHGGKRLDDVAARYIQKLGFDPVEYKESMEAMRRAGWDHVGRETATREQHMQGNVLATRTGKYLDVGLLPFKKSEEFIRNAGWNAAFLEWKGRNPGKKMNDADIRAIVARADLFTVNMTQASNSALQEGAASFATQFWSYQMRLTEQFFGKRLNWSEKIKLWGTYSMIYGLPVGTAGVVGFWPVHESLRKYALDSQWNMDDTAIEKFANDGVLSLVTELMAGEKTNINQVMGPNGIPFFYEMLFEDKTLIEALTGASGSIFARYAEDITPILPWTLSLLNPYEPTIQPKIEDFWDVVGNINTLSQVEKVYYAYNYGKLFDKYGATIDPSFEGISAFMYSLSGTLPDRVEDNYALYSLDVREKRMKIKQEKMIKEDLKKAMGASSIDEEMSYIRRAQTRSQGAGFDPKEMSTIVFDAIRDNRSAIENRMLNYRDRTLEEKEFLRKKYESYGIKQ